MANIAQSLALRFSLDVIQVLGIEAAEEDPCLVFTKALRWAKRSATV